MYVFLSLESLFWRNFIDFFMFYLFELLALAFTMHIPYGLIYIKIFMLHLH